MKTLRIEGTSLEIGAGFYDGALKDHVVRVLRTMQTQLPAEDVERETGDFILGMCAGLFGTIQGAIGHDNALQLIDQLRGYAEKMKAEDRAGQQQAAHGLH